MTNYNNLGDLLTTKQVIGLLKIDRITLYRMVKSKRIRGIKVGSHWRFSRAEVEKVINSDGRQETQNAEASRDILPLHCIEPIQDVFADLAQIAVVTTDAAGVPLTRFSNSCRFCEMIRSTEKGRRACIASWKATASKTDTAPRFHTCHAGLSYATADITQDGNTIAMLIAGQFLLEDPSTGMEAKIAGISGDLGLDPDALRAAARQIPVIDDTKKQLLGKWLEKVARSFETIARERKELMNRLKNIAEIAIDPSSQDREGGMRDAGRSGSGLQGDVMSHAHLEDQEGD